MSDQLAMFDYTIGLGVPKIVIAETKPAYKLHRETDFDTARMAAKKASKRGPNQRQRVLEHLQAVGEATDYEIGQALGILRSSAAKRRQELTEAGLVEDSNKRRNTDTGTSAIVWRTRHGIRPQ